MPNEKFFNKKRCRYHKVASLWISSDGTEAAYVVKNKDHSYFRPDRINHPPVKTWFDGRKYVTNRFKIDYDVSCLVCETWGPLPPDDGNLYMLNHKDGNVGNNDCKNLEWIPYHYKHTKEPKTKIVIHGVGLTVFSDGQIKEGRKNASITDCIFDSDVDLFYYTGPKVIIKLSRSREMVDIDEIMRRAGYVQGDDANLTSPVILHKDLDPLNFSSDNLEFVESSDSRYLEFLEKKEELKKSKIRRLNPGSHLPEGW